MVVVLAVQKWCHFLLGRHFIVRIDQQSLRFLMDQRLLDPTLLRWITKLLGFDFEIQYKSRVANRVADALSQCGADSDLSLSAFLVSNFIDTATLRCEQLADPVLRVIISNIREGMVVRDGNVLKDDLLLFKG